MANTVRILRSTTAGATPSSLATGQIAINEADGKIFYRNAAGVVTQFSAGGVSDPYDLGTYPLITVSAQPSSTTVTVGQSATLSVTAAATLPTATILYQWQLSTDSGSTYSNVSGATSSSLSFSNLQTSSSGYRYRCRLTANLSQVFTSAATLTVNPPFIPQAVLLTSGTSYTVPAGASTMKAWAVGGGARAGNASAAGGCAYKTWGVSSGQSVSYSVAAAITGDFGVSPGGNTTITFSGTTITGYGGSGTASGTGGSFAGGDGGANGGSGAAFSGGSYGGAVGGNGTVASCGRRTMTDVSGLKAALTLAGASVTESCDVTAAFGSGGYGNKYNNPSRVNPGLGGGAGHTNYDGRQTPGGGGAVVLYFT